MKKNIKKRAFKIIFALTMILSMTACSRGKENVGSNTLVIGTSKFNGIFSPFFYQTAYDAQAFELIFVNVCELNEDNELMDKAGHINAELIEHEDGSVQTEYTITLKENMRFSDGEAVTVDDLIFSYYVLADPTYDGTDTFASSIDIVGLEEYVNDDLTDGVDVETISGITRVDDLTCKVLVDGINVIGDRILAQLPIVPEHYYGEGFTKGNLDGVKAKNDSPMGSGPFTWVGYENNIVTVKRNEDYFLGAPKIEYVKYQVIDEEQKVDAIINGDIDITDPAASVETVKELTDADIPYSLMGYPGYGYIAVSAKRVPDLKVREGLMHLMTRSQAIKTYYGEMAQVIERPMTPTLTEYPEDAKEYWGYDPAKALECFKEAGYEQINGKLMKGGKQLVVEVGIGEASAHPSTPILTQMANDLKAMGGQLIISDMDFSLLNNRVQNDDIDMWVMAWGNSTNPDMTQIYGSEYVKAGGSNRTWIQDKELDEIMEEIMQTLDLEERRLLVAEALDKVMSWATMMPVYQRNEMIIYNPDRVNMDTVPQNTSTYYNYVNEIEKLEVY
ncbi:MAG: ABC transporter substrate-binding protein [Lachnospiraceae bacterium]|nr:ABC transporter substrate-binding protein [Lachnospiraceae bacterium]